MAIMPHKRKSKSFLISNQNREKVIQPEKEHVMKREGVHEYHGQMLGILLFSLCCVMASWAQAPISITTIEELQRIGNEPEYPLNGHYVLANDLDASSTRFWNNGKGFEPIGYLDYYDDYAFEFENYPFTGIFDGQGHVITGLHINRPDEDAVGLFSLVRLGGVITNLGIQGGSVTGRRLVGGLLGVGNECTVSNCFFRGKVSSNCGENYYMIISTGGLIGRSQIMTAERSYAVVEVSGCREVGGLIGADHGSLISQCYARGIVSGQQEVGGLIGGVSGRISECYVAAAVYCPTGQGVFGIGNKPVLEAIFWDQQISGVTTSGGGSAVVALTTAQMMSPDSFVSAGWDFDEVWNINPGVSYPFFRIWEGVTETVVPDLTGMTVSEATVVLAQADLGAVTSIERYHETVSAGIVFDQIPVAGAVLNTGSPVAVVVSRGPAPAVLAIPNLSGLTQDTAEGLLRAEAFSVGRISLRYDETAPAGLVVDQHPAAGTTAPAYSEVNFVVSNGSAPAGVIPISSIESLQQIGATPEYPNSGHYVLTQNIDASATSQWNKGEGFVPLCMFPPNGEAPFTGIFDGQGYTITGLYINQNLDAPTGLFSTIAPDAVVCSVTLEACTVTGGDSVGGLAGQVYMATIDNCAMSGVVTASGAKCGGLLGDCMGTSITRCKANAEVRGGELTGGLVARNSDYGDIQEGRFEGQVTGTGNTVGGLTGFAYNILHCTVHATVTGRGSYVGGLAGGAAAVVQDCFVEVTVEGDAGYVGGLLGVGDYGATVENCRVKGAVTAAGDYVGGLTGYCNCVVTDSIAEIVVSGNSRVGGLIGHYMRNDTLRDCHATGAVSGGSEVGGLIGYNDSGAVEQCYAAVDIIANGEAVGGLIGRVYRWVTWKSYATGSVYAPGASAVGGLIGHMQGMDSRTSDCYASGAVTGNTRVGGLVGLNEGMVLTSYAAGKVAGTVETGGLIGFNSGSVTSAFWDTTMSGMAQSAGGMGVPTQEMMQQSTFTAGGAWNFDEIWGINEGQSYPYLRAIPSPFSPRLTIVAVSPLRQVKAPGDYVDFKVEVTESAGEPAYQWKRRNANKAFEYIPDANGPIYSINFIQEEHEGDYICDVSDMTKTVSSPVFRLVLSTSMPLSLLSWLAAAIAVALIFPKRLRRHTD